MAEPQDQEPGEDGMSPEDAERWHAARTLADLGELTAQWLEGHLEQTPTHTAPPDPETGPLLTLLAAVNRAGFVTHQSQPAYRLDENGSAQRANVSGYADNSAFARLMTAAADADLIITAARASIPESFGPFFTITLDYGEEFTWDGIAFDQATMEASYEYDCHPAAIEALCQAWQVTLIDPQWGRDAKLWAVLGAFAAQQQT
jgi:hypothetical protein